MRKFILRCLLFFVIVSLLLTGIGFIPRHKPSNDYLYGVALKHRLGQSIQMPKIILAGGSNVAFGLDSREIKDSLKMPVVNLGIHAGLGLDFILNELQEVIRPDDVVFLAPEYFLSSRGEWGLKKQASAFYPKARNYYSWDPEAQLQYYLCHNQQILWELLGGTVAGGKDTIYNRDAFDPGNGDVVIHLNKSPHKQLTGIGKELAYRPWEGIDAINRFARFARTYNVKVYFFFPAFPDSSYRLNQQVIAKYESDIRKGLDIDVLGRPADFVYPDSLFFDTEYHLAAVGRKMRTNKLIGLVRPKLKTPGILLAQFSK